MNQANRQLRIVGKDGSNADQDGVVAGSQLVRHNTCGGAGDPPGLTSGGRDPPIKRLGNLQRHSWPEAVCRHVLAILCTQTVRTWKTLRTKRWTRSEARIDTVDARIAAGNDLEMGALPTDRVVCGLQFFPLPRRDLSILRTQFAGIT
jgi:hypothetical protein